jgi:hypothetical protein
MRDCRHLLRPTTSLPRLLVLGPYQTLVMQASQQNQDYLDAANLNVSGNQSVVQTIQQTGILPEGNYEICLRAIDFFTQLPLSPEAPSGCAFFSILYAQPPFLISPICADSVTVTNNIATFAWTPVSAPTLMPMLYDFYAVKLMAGQNPNDAINAAINYNAGNPIKKLNLVTTTTVTLPSDLPLEGGSWYAWCVVAHDPGQTVWVENNGRSEVCTFYVKPTFIPITLTDTGTNGTSPSLNVTYEMPPMAIVSGNLKYRFKGDNAGSISATSATSTGAIANFNNWFTGGSTGGASTGGTGGGSTGGISFDNFNPLNLGDAMGAFELITGQASPPPSWLLPAGYNSAGGLPLKSTGVVFTARYAVGNSATVNSLSDLTVIDMNATGNLGLTLPGQGSSSLGPCAQQVGATTTDADGNFNVYMLMTEPFGLLHAGPVTVNYGGGEFVTTISGTGLYRLVTMEIPDLRYCHPDIAFFPQPDQPLNLPQQVVHVQSYNMRVRVKANDMTVQAAGTGNPIDGAVVRLGRLSEVYNNFPPGYPQAESKMNTYGYDMGLNGPPIMLCDSNTTNGQGEILFKRLVRSTGTCNNGQDWLYAYANYADGYYVEAYSHPYIGNYNYNKKYFWNVALCGDANAGGNSTGGVVFSTVYFQPRSHSYTVPEFEFEITLSPNNPEIYALVRTDYGTGPVPVPHTNLLFEVKKPNSPVTYKVLQTDANGLLKKQIGPADFYNGFAWKGQDGVFNTGYKMTPVKLGFNQNYCNGCTGINNAYRFLKMGERWTPDAHMTPKGKVKGVVQDEDGNPIAGEIKIGDGVFIPLELLMVYVNDSNGPGGISAGDIPNLGGSTIPPLSGSGGGISAGSIGSGIGAGINFNGPSTSAGVGSIASGGIGNIGNLAGTAGIGSGTGAVDFNGSIPITNGSIGISGGSGSTAGGMVGGFTTTDSGIGIMANFAMKSVFDMPAQSGTQIPIIVKPYATNLFVDTFYVTIPTNNTALPTDLGTFTVRKKLHRPIFNVKTAGLINNPISGAQVIVSDMPAVLTNSQGKASFKFPSPADEFRVQVIKDGYAIYDEHVAIPISKTAKNINIFLTPGYSISGIVSNAQTGLPISGATVVCVIGANEYGDIVIETTSGTNGAYTLNNVPGGIRMLRANYSNETITYLSEIKYTPCPAPGQVNIALTAAPFHLPNIWNMPVEIHAFQPYQTGWKVSGALKNLHANSRFKPEKDNQRLHFFDVPVVPTGEGTNNQGQTKVWPSVSSFNIAETQFRAILNDQHVINLTGPPNSGGIFFTYNPLLPAVTLNIMKVQKNNATDNGELRAKAYMMLEAFRMEYQYNSHFYLGETPNSANIAPFKGATDTNMPDIYRLMDLAPGTQQVRNPKYTVHEFPAFADRNLSYCRADSLVLRTKLEVDLPQSNPDKLEVDAGKIIILPAEIQIFPGDTPLQFNLETWQVQTNSWTFSPQHGGILTSGVIKTNIFDINTPTIIIRPNELILPNAQTLTNAGINIGGIAPVHFEPGTQLSFGYYAAPQHDPNNGHWRVALFNGNGNVGHIKGMPGWTEDKKLFFKYTENFSDAYLAFSLAPGQFINHYNVINQNVTSLTKNSDGFSLNGAVDLGIPGLNTGSSLNMVYYKDQGNVKVRPNGLYTGFETYGQVHFMGDQQADRITLDWNLLKVPGWMTIYDDQSANTIMLRAMLSKTPSQVKLDIMKVNQGGLLAGDLFQKITLGGGATGKQKILEGTQLVQNGTWQPLGYLAQFEGYTGAMNGGKDKMWFKVTGAIANDTSKPESIELANVPTPFGDFSLAMLFESMEIVGALSMENIPFGSVVINQGSAEMRAGGKGFYLVAALNATYPVIGVLQTNFIAGWYPNITPEANAILQNGMYIKKLPNFMQSGGIHGLYICANKPLIHVDEEINLLLFAAGLYIDTGVDTRFWVNFSDAAGGAHIGGLAYFDMELYASVLGICEICFGLLAEVGFDTDVTWSPQSSFSAQVCGTIGVNMGMCGETINKTAKAVGSYSSNSGLNIDVIFDQTCGNPLNIGSNGCKHF